MNCLSSLCQCIYFLYPNCWHLFLLLQTSCQSCHSWIARLLTLNHVHVDVEPVFAYLLFGFIIYCSQTTKAYVAKVQVPILRFWAYRRKVIPERINKCDIYVFIYFIFFVPGPGKGQTTGPCHYPRKYTINV
jgi:hypothetical protein